MNNDRSIDPADNERFLTTLFWTDIVDSTSKVFGASDAWRHLLNAFYELCDEMVLRFHGENIERKGDGTLSIFRLPSNAIDCAMAVRTEVQGLHLQIRIGLHFGEVDRTPEGLGGPAIHLAARVVEVAQAGEILVSSTVKELMMGSRIKFVARGLHDLKGIPEAQHLYAIAS